MNLSRLLLCLGIIIIGSLVHIAIARLFRRNLHRVFPELVNIDPKERTSIFWQAMRNKSTTTWSIIILAPFVAIIALSKAELSSQGILPSWCIPLLLVYAAVIIGITMPVLITKKAIRRHMLDILNSTHKRSG